MTRRERYLDLVAERERLCRHAVRFLGKGTAIRGQMEQEADDWRAISDLLRHVEIVEE